MQSVITCSVCCKGDDGCYVNIQTLCHDRCLQCIKCGLSADDGCYVNSQTLCHARCHDACFD